MILCLGTTPAVQRVMVFDRFVPGGRNTATAVHDCAAGKSVNAAKVVHALGETALAMTFTGGATGNLIRGDLDRLGVAHDLVSVAHPTRVCVTAVSQADGKVTEFVEESGPVTAGELDLLWSRFRHAIDKTNLLLLCGSLAPGVPVDFYARCITEASSRGVPSVLDAQGEPLRRALPCRPLLVKPNRAELAATVGANVSTDRELHDAVRRLIASGPAWAVITSGGGAIIVSDGNGFWRLSPPRVDVVSPIGSGDSFAAGLAVALARGTPLPDAAKLAVACGASNAAHLLPGQVDPGEVRRLETRIAVEAIDASGA